MDIPTVLYCKHLKKTEKYATHLFPCSSVFDTQVEPVHGNIALAPFIIKPSYSSSPKTHSFRSIQAQKTRSRVVGNVRRKVSVGAPSDAYLTTDLVIRISGLPSPFASGITPMIT